MVIENTKGYNGNKFLPKSGVKHNWTPAMVLEYKKCMEDPIYFAEKYIKIVHVDHGLIPIRLYDYQKEIITNTFECRNNIVCTSRQAGKTTTACVIILHYIIFNTYKTVALLANKGDSAREILDRIKTSFESLPDWLKPGVEEWNKGSVQFENGCKILAGATSSSSIRGKSVAYLYIDETAFCEHWDEFYTSVYPTLSSGKETKLLFTSTPNGLNHFHAFWEGAQAEGVAWNGFKSVEVAWDRVPGRDEKWKEDTLKSMNYDTEKFAQEFECSFIGSSGTLIAGWKLKLMKPKYPLFSSKEGLVQYEEPFGKNKYAIVVDVSRGKGIDYSAFQVIDVTTAKYQQVCVFRSNQILPYDYAQIVYRVAKTYNQAHVLVEVNDIGAQVADILWEDLEYDNILFTESNGRAGKKISTGFGRKGSRDQGIRTTKTVKAVGCSMLKMMVESDKLTINDKATIDELNRFSKKGNSWEAEEGFHDDLVMGLVLFGWLADQNFFKEETGINIVTELQEKDEEEMVPFFVDNGVDDYNSDDFWKPEKKDYKDSIWEDSEIRIGSSPK
jgi:hypothetical protein